MDSVLISASSAEQLQVEVKKFLKHGAGNVLGAPPEMVINVQSFTKQIVTPNPLDPRQQKIEFIFQLLIIYK